MKSVNTIHSWALSFRAFLKPSVITMLFLGFSAGIPLLLIFSSLSLWLRESGVERAAVTFFSWAALGYSFKFVWAPLVDRLPVPILTNKLGRRRSWILLAQLSIIISILGMAFTDPASSSSSLTAMAIFALMLGFSAATQDIGIDAYRIESDTPDMQALLSSTYIAGYRIAMIVSGAGALLLASWFGSEMGSYRYSAWLSTYVIMAATMLIGVTTTLIMSEPGSSRLKPSNYTTLDYTRFVVFFLILACLFVLTFFLSADFSKALNEFLSEKLGTGLGKFLTEALRLLTAVIVSFGGAKFLLTTRLVNPKMVSEAYLSPVKEFFQRYGNTVALLLLALVGLYRISDIVLGVISNVFYQDLGFTKDQIAAVVKTFGLMMTIVGGFLGGVLAVRYGVMRILFLGAALSAATNLLFMVLAAMGNNLLFLYIVISADNLSAGLASAAFVAFLSSLTNVSFTAIQYAIFSSLMTLIPKLIGGYSGTIVDLVGYPSFFTITAIMGIPVLYLIWVAEKKLDIKTALVNKLV